VARRRGAQVEHGGELVSGKRDRAPQVAPPYTRAAGRAPSSRRAIATHPCTCDHFKAEHEHPECTDDNCAHWKNPNRTDHGCLVEGCWCATYSALDLDWRTKHPLCESARCFSRCAGQIEICTPCVLVRALRSGAHLFDEEEERQAAMYATIGALTTIDDTEDRLCELLEAAALAVRPRAVPQLVIDALGLLAAPLLALICVLAGCNSHGSSTDAGDGSRGLVFLADAGELDALPLEGDGGELDASDGAQLEGDAGELDASDGAQLEGNACGGELELEHEPQSPCPPPGLCSSGVARWHCLNSESVYCLCESP
jgi:hypothetical protein